VLGSSTRIRLVAWWRRFAAATLRADSGSAGAELALSLPILLIFVVGTADYGVMAYQEAGLVAAARAGAGYVSGYVRASNTFNSSALPTAAQMASNTSLPVGGAFQSPSLAYACSGSLGTAIKTTTSWGSNCSTGNEMDYVQVTAEINPYTPLLGSNLGIASFFIPAKLTATAYIRVQ
jgi:Flp pilus assembly protein TadG